MCNFFECTIEKNLHSSILKKGGTPARFTQLKIFKMELCYAYL